MKKVIKTPVYFIATKYKNDPVKVSFYTMEGGEVPEEKVEKKATKTGVELFTLNV